MCQELTFEIANELMHLDPETGKLFWEKRDRKWFSRDHDHKNWNKRYAGREALATNNGHGYKRGAVFDKKYQAHRVVWLLHTGVWPKGLIDHKNGVRDDNRPSNLRDVTHLGNARNQGLRTTNKSGVTGIYWSKPHRKWRAQIFTGRRLKHLGYFETKCEAISARKAAERKAGFHPNHGSIRKQYQPIEACGGSYDGSRN